MLLPVALMVVGVALSLISLYITVQAPQICKNIHFIDSIRKPLNLTHTQMMDVLGGLNPIEYADVYYKGVSYGRTDLSKRVSVLGTIVSRLEKVQAIAPGYQLVYGPIASFSRERLSIPVTTRLSDLYAIDYFLVKELNRYIGGTN